MCKTKSKKWIKPVIFIAAGLVLGLLYALFIDTASRPAVTAISGAVAGLVLYVFSKGGLCCSGGSSNSSCGQFTCR